MTLELAIRLLSLPRNIGPHPEDGEPIEAGLGRYGPFVRHGRTYANLESIDEAFTLGMNRAVELIAHKRANPGRGRGAAQKPLREIGEHPDGGVISLMDGKYGPYLKWEKTNATVPKETPVESLTLEEAVALVNAKATSKGKTRKTAAKKTATKKPAAKKSATGTGTRKKATRANGKASKSQKPRGSSDDTDDPPLIEE